MKKGKFWRVFCLSLALLMMLAVFGCGAEEEVADDDVADDEITDEVVEEVEGHYFPWLSHGSLTLSTGEEIMEPSFFDSDNDDISAGELKSGDSVTVKKIWPVAEGDVFELDWVQLDFDVTNNYVETSDDYYNLNFDIKIDDFKDGGPTEGDIREYDLAIIEYYDDMQVSVEKVILAKNQEDHDGETYDYVALIINMINNK